MSAAPRIEMYYVYWQHHTSTLTTLNNRDHKPVCVHCALLSMSRIADEKASGGEPGSTAVRLLSSRGKPNIRIIWRLTVAFKWHHDMMLALPILAKFL